MLQNNLTHNLPLVCNLPPESFSVKDPHLLKPPPALSGFSTAGRRASDGDAYLHTKYGSNPSNFAKMIRSRAALYSKLYGPW